MFILSWSVSPSCSKLLISSSKLLFLTITLNAFQMKLKEFWLRIFTRFLKYQWWHNVYRFKGNCLQRRVLYPKFQKMSYFFDIHFPRSTIWHHNQVSFPLYDIFVCISLILLEYCSTDPLPEVGFVIPVLVGVTAVSDVIIRCYIVTVINFSIRIDDIFSTFSSANQMKK